MRVEAEGERSSTGSGVSGSLVCSDGSGSVGLRPEPGPRLGCTKCTLPSSVTLRHLYTLRYSRVDSEGIRRTGFAHGCEIGSGYRALCFRGYAAATGPYSEKAGTGKCAQRRKGKWNPFLPACLVLSGWQKVPSGSLGVEDFL